MLVYFSSINAPAPNLDCAECPTLRLCVSVKQQWKIGLHRRSALCLLWCHPPIPKYIWIPVWERDNGMIIPQNVTLCFKLNCCRHSYVGGCAHAWFFSSTRPNSLGGWWSSLRAGTKWMLGSEYLHCAAVWGWGEVELITLTVLSYLLRDQLGQELKSVLVRSVCQAFSQFILLFVKLYWTIVMFCRGMWSLKTHACSALWSWALLPPLPELANTECL